MKFTFFSSVYLQKEMRLGHVIKAAMFFAH